MDYYQNDYNSQNKTNTGQNNANSHFTYDNSEQRKKFAIAALVCGIVSILSCCTVFVSIAAGSLGILFTILARRKGQKMDSLSLAGLSTSIIGLVLGIVITVYAFFIIFTAMLFPNSNSDISRQFDSTFEQMYGIPFDEFLEEYLEQYGVDID